MMAFFVLDTCCPNCGSGQARPTGRGSLICAGCEHGFTPEEGRQAKRERVPNRDTLTPNRDMANMHDLRMLGRKNGVIAAHLDLWERGAFCTLERMLISLACHLGTMVIAAEPMIRMPGKPISPAAKEEIERALRETGGSVLTMPNGANLAWRVVNRHFGGNKVVQETTDLEVVCKHGHGPFAPNWNVPVNERVEAPFEVYAGKCGVEGCNKVYFRIAEVRVGPFDKADVLDPAVKPLFPADAPANKITPGTLFCSICEEEFPEPPETGEEFRRLWVNSQTGFVVCDTSKCRGRVGMALVHELLGLKPTIEAVRLMRDAQLDAALAPPPPQRVGVSEVQVMSIE